LTPVAALVSSAPYTGVKRCTARTDPVVVVVVEEVAEEELTVSALDGALAAE
jgi:hypothetical protein